MFSYRIALDERIPQNKVGAGLTVFFEVDVGLTLVWDLAVFSTSQCITKKNVPLWASVHAFTVDNLCLSTI